MGIFSFQVLLFAFFFLVIVFAYHFRRQRTKKLLNSQAIKRNGSIKGSFFPLLSLPFLNFSISVGLFHSSKSNPEQTLIQSRIIVDREHCFKIVPKNMVNFFEKPLTYKDIKLIDDRFNYFYRIFAKNEVLISSFLDNHIKDSLIAAADYKPTVELSKNSFSVKFLVYPKEDEILDFLIDNSLIYLKRLNDLNIILRTNS